MTAYVYNYYYFLFGGDVKVKRNYICAPTVFLSLNFILKANEIGPPFSTCPYHQATYKFHAQIHVMGKFWCAANWLECEWLFDICFCLCFGFEFGIELVREWVAKSQPSFCKSCIYPPYWTKSFIFPTIYHCFYESKFSKFCYKISVFWQNIYIRLISMGYTGTPPLTQFFGPSKKGGVLLY